MNDLSESKLKQAEHVITMAHQMSMLHAQALMLKEAVELIAQKAGVDLSPLIEKYTPQIEAAQSKMEHQVEELRARWDLSKTEMTESRAAVVDGERLVQWLDGYNDSATPRQPPAGTVKTVDPFDLPK